MVLMKKRWKLNKNNIERKKQATASWDYKHDVWNGIKCDEPRITIKKYEQENQPIGGAKRRDPTMVVPLEPWTPIFSDEKRTWISLSKTVNIFKIGLVNFIKT